MAVFSTGGGKARSLVNYVGWIQSSGTQYIDTGVKPTYNTRIKAKIDGGTYIACRSSSTNRYAIYTTRNEGAVDLYFGGTGYLSKVFYGLTSPFTLELENGKLTANGTAYTFSEQAAFSVAYSLAIFGQNASGTVTPTAGGLYYCQIYEGGTLVRDYRPCYDPDGVACLYDEVNGEYVYNAGTGEFTAGGVAEENVKYREYIQSSGTQYIDTGFKPTPNTRVDIDFQLTETTGQQRIFANSAYHGDSLNVEFYVGGAGAFGYSYQDSTNNWAATGVTADTERHTFVLDGKNKTVTLDSSFSGSLSALTATATASLNLALFGMTHGASNHIYARMKLYSCQIYDNGVLVRDYRPCVDGAGTACLYDRVGCEYVYNSGTGVFEVAA